MRSSSVGLFHESAPSDHLLALPMFAKSPNRVGIASPARLKQLPNCPKAKRNQGAGCPCRYGLPISPGVRHPRHEDNVFIQMHLAANLCSSSTVLTASVGSISANR